MTERNLTGQSEQEIQRDGEHRVDADKHHHIHKVAALEEERGDQDRQRKECECQEIPFSPCHRFFPTQPMRMPLCVS